MGRQLLGINQFSYHGVVVRPFWMWRQQQGELASPIVAVCREAPPGRLVSGIWCVLLVASFAVDLSEHALNGLSGRVRFAWSTSDAKAAPSSVSGLGPVGAAGPQPVRQRLWCWLAEQPGTRIMQAGDLSCPTGRRRNPK